MSSVAPAPVAPPLQPVAGGERVVLIDALRGFALAGVFLANLVPWFAGTALVGEEGFARFPLHAANVAVVALMVAFVMDKFIGLFSLLFGLGFSIQLDRAEARGARLAPTYLRRLGVLLLLGLAHNFLLWSGDILHFYAVLGFGLLLFRRRTDRTLLWWGLGLGLLVPLVLTAGFTLLGPGGGDAEGPPPAVTAAYEAYTSGSYGEALRANAALYVLRLPYLWLTLVPVVFGRFLLGVWAGRKRLLHDPEAHRPLLRRLCRVGLGVGLPAALGVGVFVAAGFLDARPEGMPWDLVMLLAPVAALALTVAYASGFALLYLRPAWRRRLDGLAPVGQMALTNYLAQTVIGVGLFYGVGLGLMGALGPALLVPVWLAAFGAQVAFSRWWLARFRFGPAEWAWRVLTYGHRLPLRRVAPAGLDGAPASAAP